jgi:hypothetical protein
MSFDVFKPERQKTLHFIVTWREHFPLHAKVLELQAQLNLADMRYDGKNELGENRTYNKIKKNKLQCCFTNI